MSDDTFTAAKLYDAMKLVQRVAPAEPNMGKIIESVYCADQVADYSGCRSPSRAARRYRRGIRGRVKIVSVLWKHAHKLPDGSLVMHPATAEHMRKEIAARMNTQIESRLFNALHGV